MTTPELRKALYNYLSLQGQYVCHEVAIPKDYEKAYAKAKATGTKFMWEGRVDMLMYHKNYREQQGTFRFYEMKISVSDFNSPNGHNLEGNLNYYVVPNRELFAKIKDKIPAGVGCLVYEGESRGKSSFSVIKKPRRQELQCDYMKLIHNFITALSRECCKHNVGYYKAR